MEEDEAAGPIDVGILGAQAVMPHPEPLPKPVEEPGGVPGMQSVRYRSA